MARSVQGVRETLRDRILTQQLRPPEWIDEPNAANEIGISRTPCEKR
jgi:DNA-binding GntR family transcriptional regulator